MLLGPIPKPHPAQGAGDAFLQPHIPPRFERFLNVLLILAALHFLIQTAICFSCLFLVLPASFAISNAISGANTVMDPPLDRNLQVEPHVDQGAAERTVRAQQTVFLPYIQGIQDLMVSMAAVYFLIRAGLLFCNLLFILPLVFFLKETNSS